MTTNTKNKLVNTQEAADYLSLSKRTLNNNRSSGTGLKIPFVKLGGAIRYRLSDLEQIIQNNIFNHTGEEKAKGGAYE